MGVSSRRGVKDDNGGTHESEGARGDLIIIAWDSTPLVNGSSPVKTLVSQLRTDTTNGRQVETIRGGSAGAIVKEHSMAAEILGDPTRRKTRRCFRKR